MSKEKKRVPFHGLAKPVVATAMVASAVLPMIPAGQAEAASAFAGGSGTVTDPFLIENAEQLVGVKNYLSSHYKLTADIDLSGIDWIPVGENDKNPFKGTFDGNGHTISHLKISSNKEYTGLFGYTYQATIQNVQLADVNVTSTQNFTGALVGHAKSTVIKNDGVIRGKVKGAHQTGGLIGLASYSYGITNIYSEVNVEGASYTGGLIGLCQYSSITNAYATGNAEGTYNTGGLVGHNFDTKITNVYAAGNVKGGGNTGGLVGLASTSISNAYALNLNVTGSDSTTTGRVIGKKDKDWSIVNIVALDNMNYSGHSSYISKKITTNQAMQQQTYSTFNFSSDWGIDEGETLPYLLFNPIKTKYDPATGTWVTEGKKTANQAPVVTTTIPDQTLEVGKNKAIDVSSYFNDADGDTLTYVVSTGNVGVATGSFNGSTLTLTPKAKGTTTVTVSANDGKGGTVSQTFNVTVTEPSNQGNNTIPPVVGTDYIVLEWLAVPGAARYEVRQDGKTIHTQQEDGSPSYSYNVENLTPGQKYRFEIIPIAADDSEIPDGEIDFGEIVVTPPINLTVETVKDQVKANWTTFDKAIRYDLVVKDATGKVVKELSTTKLTESFSLAKEGNYTLTVYPVLSGDKKAAGVAKDFIISLPNTAPTVTTIPNQTTVRGKVKTVNLSIYFKDADQDTLSYSVTSSDEKIGAVSVNGDTLTLAPKALGLSTITVTANDGKGGKVLQTFTFAVENQDPTGKVIPNQKATMGKDHTVALGTYFSDKDQDSLSYTVSVENGAIAGGAITGSTLTLSPKAVGTTKVTVTANDGMGGTVSETFNLTVQTDPSTGGGNDDGSTTDRKLTVTANGTSITAEWDALKDATSYKVDVFYKRENGTWSKLTAASKTVTDTTLTAEGLPENTEIKVEVTPRIGSKTQYNDALEKTVTTGANSNNEGDGGDQEVSKRELTLTADGTNLQASWTELKDATDYKVDVYYKRENGAWSKVTAASKTVTETTLTAEGLPENTEIKVVVTPRIGSKAQYSEALEKTITMGKESSNGDGDGPQEPEVEHKATVTVKEDKVLVEWDAFEEATDYSVNLYMKKEDGTWTKLTKYSGIYKEVSFEMSKDELPKGIELKIQITPRVGTQHRYDLAMEKVFQVDTVETFSYALVNAEGVTLHLPEGKDITQYKIQRLVRQEDGTFVKDGVAKAAADPLFIDTGVEEGKGYRYEVILRHDYAYDYNNPIVLDAPSKQADTTMVVFDLKEGETLTIQRYTVAEDGTKTAVGDPFTVDQPVFEETESGEFVYEKVTVK